MNATLGETSPLQKKNGLANSCFFKKINSTLFKVTHFANATIPETWVYMCVKSADFIQWQSIHSLKTML